MISKIYKSNIPIWEAGTLKGEKLKKIKENFNKQNSYKRKPDNSLTNDMKTKKRLQARFRELNPHLFNK
jgi:hypothetical protein